VRPDADEGAETRENIHRISVLFRRDRPLTHGTAIQYVTANYGVVCGVPRDKGFGESYLTTVYAY